MVFSIMVNPGAENGSYHWLQYFINARECLTQYQLWDEMSEFFILSNDTDNGNNCNNAYWMHPECLLFCVINSDFSTQPEKDQALAFELEFRKVKAKSKSKKVRKFIPPIQKECNLDAVRPINFVNWDVIAKKKKTPSPALGKIPDQELPQLISNNVAMKKIIRDKYSLHNRVHSQDCERYIHLGAEMVKRAFGHDNQRSKLISTEDSRERFCGKTTILNVLNNL